LLKAKDASGYYGYRDATLSAEAAAAVRCTVMLPLSARWGHIKGRGRAPHIDNLGTRWELSTPSSGRFIGRDRETR